MQVDHLVQTRSHALEHVANVLEHGARLFADIHMHAAVGIDAYAFEGVVGFACTGSRQYRLGGRRY